MIASHGNLRQTWLILIGAAVPLSLGMGIRQSFGPFLTPVTRDLALTAPDFTLASTYLAICGQDPMLNAEALAVIGGANCIGCRLARREVPEAHPAAVWSQKMFGTRYMATLLGIAFVMHQVGSSLGAWGGGLIFDVTGSYDRAWQIGVLIGLTAGIVQIFAGGPKRRHDQLLEPRFATT